MENLKKAVDLDSNNSNAYFALSDAYKLSGDKQKAPVNAETL